MLQRVDLSRVIICEFNQHQVIYLKERNGMRELPVVIGLFEATTIDRKLRRLPSERPLTHDLFRQAVGALGGEIESVEIYKVEGQTFFAHLKIRQDNKLVLLDARPSDALALAYCYDPPLPIFVQEEVMEAAGQ